MLGGKEVPGDRVLVYDAEGYFMGGSMAEKYARAGKQVVYVTPRPAAGPYLEYTGESQLVDPMLQELGIQVVTGCIVTQIRDGVVSGRRPHHDELDWSTDAVILVTRREPRTSLYQQLISRTEDLAEAGISAVYRIGDCLSPRQQVADAIFDGHRLAREIEAEDPMTPLPWIREERFIGASDADYNAMRLPATHARHNQKGVDGQ
jgi:dimethylamine/trimethylamine dehydrogenase